MSTAKLDLAGSNRSNSGFALIELIVAVAVLWTLSALAVPLVRIQIRHRQEVELLADLREMRHAIERYKDMADANLLGFQKAGSDNYPESLQILVNGAPLANSYVKMRFLRRIPRDPFTGSTDWGIHSTQDDPRSKSWGGQNVFDVYTKCGLLDGKGEPYSDW
jgi:general secretion pathway protein G